LPAATPRLTETSREPEYHPALEAVLIKRRRVEYRGTIEAPNGPVGVLCGRPMAGRHRGPRGIHMLYQWLHPQSQGAGILRVSACQAYSGECEANEQAEPDHACHYYRISQFMAGVFLSGRSQWTALQLLLQRFQAPEVHWNSLCG